MKENRPLFIVIGIVLFGMFIYEIFFRQEQKQLEQIGNLYINSGANKGESETIIPPSLKWYNPFKEDNK